MSNRTLATLAAAVIALLWTLPASAQSRVDCKNGNWCPNGFSCLLNNLCAPDVDALPGSIQMSDGSWCAPGLRESTTKRGSCIPKDYVDCVGGLSCPPGTQCGSGDAAGTCTGGPPPTGPMCGDLQCAAGRICSSRGACMNTAYFQDCGNGTICAKSAGCRYPSGCATVGTSRTAQQPWR